jgi:hypothetical protein
LILHRPIPSESQIQSVKLVRTRTGDRFRYHVCFTLRIPAVQAAAVDRVAPSIEDDGGAAIGIDVGFRKMPNGALRVAMCAHRDTRSAFKPMPVEMPPDMLASFDRVDALRSELDQTAAVLGESLKPLLKAAPSLPADHPKAKLIAFVLQTGQKRPLPFETAYKMATWLHYEPSALPQQAKSEIERWHSKNVSAYREMHNLRAKALGRRKHCYRNFAAQVVRTAKEQGWAIHLEKLDISKWAEAKDVENPLSNTARAQRVLAAPSELRAAVRNAAQREGVAVREVPAANTSKTCSACGHINQRTSEVEWTCSACGVVHDRDVNAAVNIARSAVKK